MITVIIPLRNNDNGIQLRYALRSICRHHNVTRCILVGGKPNWYTGEHLPFKDYSFEHKERNIRDKVHAGAQLVKGEFMFANDDHILMQPLSCTWNKGLLSEEIAKRIGNGSYTRMLNNTLNLYGDVYNVDCHCPMMMHTEGVERTMFDWPLFGIGFKTCYAQENNVPSIFMEDCKIDKGVPDRPWFSLTDRYNVKQLENIFPDACKFEKDYIP